MQINDLNKAIESLDNTLFRESLRDEDYDEDYSSSRSFPRPKISGKVKS
jgi:hypothetical protein